MGDPRVRAKRRDPRSCVSIATASVSSGMWGILLLGGLLACGSVNMNSTGEKRVRVDRHAAYRKAHELQSQLPQCEVVPAESSPHPRTGPIVVVLDTSGSTRDPSGFDVDGDGAIGYDPRLELVAPGTYPPEIGNADPGDSVLVAEVLAACEWASIHMMGESEVGVVSFAGKIDPKTGRADYSEPPARVVAELTTDPSEIEAAFNEILRLGSSGGTDYSAAITLATRVLARAEGEGRKKILFLTDGVPSLPVGRASKVDPGDHEAAAESAREAKKAEVEIHLIFIANKRLSSIHDEIADIAESTGGTLSRSENGKNLAELMATATGALGRSDSRTSP